MPSPVNSCPACGGQSTLLAKVPTIDPVSAMVCELRGCADCSHWWIEPMPSQAELDQLYRTGSPVVIRTEWAGEDADPLSAADIAVLHSERDLPGRKYLEIGVGKGRLLKEVASRGADVVGVEPGAWGHNLPGTVTSLLEVQGDSRFDIIVANDVLEHLESPVAMLSALREHAHSTTRLYCRFPNNQSLRARVRKARWNMIRPLGHLHYFSRQSAQRMFARGGWSITEATPSEVLPRTFASKVLDFLRQGDQWLVRATPADRAALGDTKGPSSRPADWAD